jgi:hypothetical protein
VHMWGRDQFSVVATSSTSFFPVRSALLSPPQQPNPIAYFTSDDHFAIAISRDGNTFVWGSRAQTSVYGLPPPDSIDTPQIVPFGVPQVAASLVRTLNINGDCGARGLRDGRVWSVFVQGISFIPVVRTPPPVSAIDAYISFPTTCTPKAVVFPPFDWTPWVLSEQGQVFTYLNRAPSTDGPEQFRNFTQVYQDILQLLLYAPNQHAGVTTASQLYLTTGGSLFFNGTIQGLNEIPMSNVFPSDSQNRIITDMSGRFSWYWFRDDQEDLWGIGRNSDYQLCSSNNAATVTPAVKFSYFDRNASRLITGRDIIKVITVLQNEATGAPGGTILVTNYTLISCGAVGVSNASAIYNPPVSVPLALMPASLRQPGRVIVDATFGYYGGLIKLDNEEVWAYGYPHPLGAWVPVSARGALQGRIADSMTALPQGGFLISSSTS